MLKIILRYFKLAGLRGLWALIVWKVSKQSTLLKINKPFLKYPVYLRVPSSDVATFEEIFIAKVYDFNTKNKPETIIDAGANIGLASIYFINKFPETKIISIEPEKSNFIILEKNTEFYKNIYPIHGALWYENSLINIVDPGLDYYGFMTDDKKTDQRFGLPIQEVKGYTIDKIIKDHGLQHIDIIKIDIEGAEREIFRDPSLWINCIDSIIIELHERLKPGTNRSFYLNTNGFDFEWQQGDNLVLTRNGGCIIIPEYYRERMIGSI
jgi:FkbM family methyltransferase